MLDELGAPSWVGLFSPGCNKMSHTARMCAQVGNNQEFEVEGFLRRRFEGLIKEVEPVEREDLDLVRPLPPKFNHAHFD